MTGAPVAQFIDVGRDVANGSSRRLCQEVTRKFIERETFAAEVAADGNGFDHDLAARGPADGRHKVAQFER